MEQLVVLVDEKNNVLGTMPKSQAHQKNTPLHRAFSCFIFRQKDKKLLLQKRSAEKIAWPLAWSNSCCGHPGLNESNLKAAERHLQAELGIKTDFLEEAAPYRYQFSLNGIMENEICPIIIGITKEDPKLNKAEVAEIKWISWPEFLAEIKNNPQKYSPWCREEALILEKNNKLKKILI